MGSDDYWYNQAVDAEIKVEVLIAALSQIVLASTDEYAVSVAKDALAKVEE